MTNPVKSRFYGIFYFSSRTSISNLGYIISNLDTYVIIIPATFVPGKMAEWSIAAVLKTVELRGSGGSNPSLSAKEECDNLGCTLFLLSLIHI